MKKPKQGSTNWGLYYNGDLDIIDLAIGPFHGGYLQVPFAPAVVFDLTKGNTFQLTMSGNVTSSAMNQPNATNGQIVYFLLCQDATGSRTFTWPGNFNNPPAVPTTASLCTGYAWVLTPTGWYMISGGGGGGGGGGTPPGGNVNDVQKNNGAGALTAGSINDGATRVNIANDLHMKGPNPYIDATLYGVRQHTAFVAVTATCTSGSPVVTLTGASDFQNGDGIVINKCGTAATLSTPNAPTVTVRGITNGATTYNYRIIAEGYDQSLTAAGSIGSTAAGPASFGVQTATLTTYVQTNGLGTFTTASPHGFATGEEFCVTAPANECGSIFSVPTNSTFTWLRTNLPDQPSQTISGTASVPPHIKLFWTGQNNVLRWWIYRNNVVVGVAQGSEPFYDDYGWTAPTVPAYVPSAPSGVSQPGVLTSKIISGGGTTAVTLADNASSSNSAQTVLQDNCRPVVDAANAAIAIGSSVVRIPNPATSTVNGGFIFNSVCQLPTPTGFNNGGMRLEVSGTIIQTQPLVFPANWALYGVGSGYGGNPSFGINEYAEVVASPASYPQILFKSTNFAMDRIFLNQSGNQGWGLLADVSGPGGGGATNIKITNSYLGGGTESSCPLVLRGIGFGFRAEHIVTSISTNKFYSCGSIRLMMSAISTPNGTFGIGQIDDWTFIGTGLQVDNAVESSTGAIGSPWIINNAFSESVRGVPFRAHHFNEGNAIAFNWLLDSYVNSDPVNPFGPTMDFTGTRVDSLRISGLSAVGTQGVAIVGENCNGTTVSGNVIDATVGCSKGYSKVGATLMNPGPGTAYGTYGVSESQYVRVNTAGKLFVALPPPTNLSAAVAAGGAVPVGTHSYQVSAIGTDGAESAATPAGPTSVTTSSGNQTVNLTWTGVTGGNGCYHVFRDGASLQSVTSPVCATSYSDVLLTPTGESAPVGSGTGTTILSSSGVYSIRGSFGGIARSTATKTTNYTTTALDSTILCDASGGSITITLSNTNATTGQLYFVKKIDSSANTCTVAPSSGTLDGLSTLVINIQYDYATAQFGGTNWSLF